MVELSERGVVPSIIGKDYLKSYVNVRRSLFRGQGKRNKTLLPQVLDMKNVSCH